MLSHPTRFQTILATATLFLGIGLEKVVGQSRPALEARGSLETTKVDAGQNVSFSLTVANTSSSTVHNVRVADVAGANVKLSAAWWCADPSKVGPWNDLRRCLIVDALDPGQSTTVFGTLSTSDPIATAVRAIIEWEAPLVSRAEAPLGQLEVTRWQVRWAEALQSLAMPLVLAILGYALQSRLRTLEQDRNERERQRAEEAETWQLMLPISHKYTIECYTDLELAARETVQAMTEACGRPGATPDRNRLDSAFYEWLVFQTRVRVVNETGAFYFKDPTGEALIVLLLQAFSYGFIYQRPPDGGPSKLSSEQELVLRRNVGRALELMKPIPNADTVLTHLESERAARSGVWLAMADWFHARVLQADVGQSIEYLRAFRSVLAFEMNRPYSRWFSREVPLKLSADLIVSIVELCERLRSDEEFGNLADEVDDYLRGAGVSAAAIRDARQHAPASPAGGHQRPALP